MEFHSVSIQFILQPSVLRNDCRLPILVMLPSPVLIYSVYLHYCFWCKSTSCNFKGSFQNPLNMPLSMQVLSRKHKKLLATIKIVLSTQWSTRILMQYSDTKSLCRKKLRIGTLQKATCIPCLTGEKVGT